MNGFHRRVRSLPWGLLGMLGLVLLVESLISRFELDLRSGERVSYRMCREAASGQATHADILCLGTSRVELSIVPKIIEARTGQKAFNLAVCGGHVPSSYYALKRAIDHGARPSSVILEVHPHFLSRPTLQTEEHWHELLGPRETLELAWTIGDASFFASSVLAKALPSVSFRFALRDSMMAALRGQSASRRLTGMTLIRNKGCNGGAMMGTRTTQFSDRLAEAYRNQFVRLPFSIRPEHNMYLLRLLELADSHKIRVYWLIPPLDPGLQAQRDQTQLDALYDGLIWACQQRYPNLIVLDARRSSFPHETFSDAAHLGFDGAVALSAAVADAIRQPEQLAAGDRWTKLPPFSPRTVDVPIEDIAQSNREVRDAMPTLR